MDGPFTNAAQGMEQVSAGLKGVLENVMKFDSAIKGFYTNSENLAGNLKALNASATGAGNALFQGIGGVLKAISLDSSILSESLLTVMNSASGVVTNLIDMASQFDSLGAEYRQMLSSNLELSNSFGQSIDAAQEFTDRMISLEKVNGQLARSNTMLLSNKEVSAAFQYLAKNAGDARDQFLDYNGVMGNTIVKAEQVTAVLAKTSGLTTYGDQAYYQNLNKLISEQGMTFQQAIESMVDYKALSKETGLTVETISSSLNGAVSGFSKLGTVVDFAKPALEGFVTVMKKVGLGISEASSLTQTLSNSLMNVANDYGKAYVLFQQGGLDFGGGGGVLGASIGYRATMLQASPEEQEKIGYDMIEAMRDSLSGMTGGRGIVTVSEAAKSPELQTLYLQQEKMLESMYGISGQGERDRTLELLQQIETATSTGDRDRAAQLTEQFQEAQAERDATKSAQEKLGIIAQSSFGEHVKQTYLLQRQLEIFLMSERFGQKLGLGDVGAGDVVANLADTASNTLSEIDKQIAEAVNSPEKKEKMFESIYGKKFTDNPALVEQEDTGPSESKGSVTNNNFTINYSGAPGKDKIYIDTETGEAWALDPSQTVNLRGARRIRG